MFIVLTLTVVYLSMSSSVSEPFVTIDLNTAKAQRQMLQFEGERRYNDFARLQNTNTNIPADQANALLNNGVPTASSRTDSLISLLGFTEFGAADDGSGKQGAGVEQTGMVQSKINFCESLTSVDCSLLDDPRLAECGFCHKDGVNSTGKKHRGGMYISSDDQIRANEVSSANGNVKAVYNPTIGTCDPKNFSVMKENCIAKERTIQCQAAGAATTSNECGQCYGSAPAGTSGLLYYGPKGTSTNPDRATVYLHVSHPGGHTSKGMGHTITYADGKVDMGAGSDARLFDHRVTPLNLQEGDSLKIVLYGAPVVWCAWLSNSTETRTVGLDIGVQSITPSKGFTIAGGKQSLIVRKAFSAAGLDADSLLKKIPNTALWYQRRNDVMPGMITSATYGPLDVTKTIKEAATGSQNITVSNDYFQQDPQPGVRKWLSVIMDNRRTVNAIEGDSMPVSKLRNVVTIQFTMPTSLEEPMYADDKDLCPSGPIVTTETGAGIMGANSCFNADGTFNPSLYCMQQLFQSSGGTPEGTLFPKSQADARALAEKDPSTGKLSLDTTIQKFNNKSNIAIYGYDANGSPQPFANVKAAALEMFGITMNNPCDGPMAQTGPHSNECLDYLWRTSGNPGQDTVQGDPSKITYSYCGAAGNAAPLNPDGSVNQRNVDAANEYGAIPNIRAYYQSFYNRSRNTTDFDQQAVAMRECYNVKISPPSETPESCPPPNPTDWQCFGPRKLLQPEVFQVSTGYDKAREEAGTVCAKFGARVATSAELVTAQQQGADWCSSGWVSDDANPKWPMNKILPEYKWGCGSVGINTWMPPNNKAAVHCFGKKPAAGTPSVLAFTSNNSRWYNPNSMPPGISDSQVLVGQEVANTVYCGTNGSNNCMMFNNEGSCAAYIAGGNKPAGRVALPGGQLNANINKYVRDRV